MKLPSIIPSLLFFAPIRPINPLIPGTCAAAPTILLFTLASVSLCLPNPSLIAYA